MPSHNIKTIDDLMEMGPGPDTVQHTTDRHIVVHARGKHWPWDREHLHQLETRDDDEHPEITIYGGAIGSRLNELRLLAWWCEQGRCADIWCQTCEPFRRALGGAWALDQWSGFVNTIWFAPPRHPNERSHIYRGWVCALSLQAFIVDIRRNHDHPTDVFATLEAQRRLVNDPGCARTKTILAVTGFAPASPSNAAAKYNALLQALVPGGWTVATPKPASWPTL